jgi:hypothetical protein
MLYRLCSDFFPISMDRLQSRNLKFTKIINTIVEGKKTLFTLLIFLSDGFKGDEIIVSTTFLKNIRLKQSRLRLFSGATHQNYLAKLKDFLFSWIGVSMLWLR